jgi:hypothetical protein
MRDYTLYTLRLEQKMHEEVSDLAHFRKVHMSEVIREAIQLKLDQIKKPLTSRDIAL